MAVKRGLLLPLPHEHVYCVDCGSLAECYDHRDYDRPLDVRAVCFKCNHRRKSASHAPAFDEPERIEGGDRMEDVTFPLTLTMWATRAHSPRLQYYLTKQHLLGLLNAL